MVFMTKTQLQVTSALHYQRGTTRNSCFRHSQVMLQHQLLPRRPLHSRMAAASQVNCTLHNPSSSSVCPWPWRRRTLRIDNCVLPPCPNSTAVTSSGDASRSGAHTTRSISRDTRRHTETRNCAPLWYPRAELPHRKEIVCSAPHLRRLWQAVQAEQLLDTIAVSGYTREHECVR